MQKFVDEMTCEESGVTMIEYVLIAALIAVVAIAAISAVGQSTNAKFVKIDNALNSVA